MQALILAGGRGARLGSTTEQVPKALVEVGGQPVLHHLLRLCHSHGVSHVLLSLGHLASQIKASCGDGSRFGLCVTYLVEHQPLGTAGPLRFAAPFLKDTFFFLFGDIVTGLDLSTMFRYHKSQDAVMTLPVQPSDEPYSSHMISVDNETQLVMRFFGKPTRGTTFANLSFGPLFVAEPEIARYLPPQANCDVVHHLLPQILDAGGRLVAYQTTEKILDMGTPERLSRARQWFDIEQQGSL